MLNGVPSLWFTDGQGTQTAVQLEVADARIQSIFVVRNPDKLAHLKLN